MSNLQCSNAKVLMPTSSLARYLQEVTQIKKINQIMFKRIKINDKSMALVLILTIYQLI